MSNINEIEVNGVRFGLESVNKIVVAGEKPTEAPLPQIWIQPKNMRAFAYADIMMEKSAGSTNVYGNYTLDANGALVETTDTTTTATRASEFVPLFKDITYKLKVAYSFTVPSANALSWGVYFYDEEGTFINKTSISKAASTSLALNAELLAFTLPEGATQVRFLLPYGSYIRYAFLTVGNTTITTTDYSKFSNYSFEPGVTKIYALQDGHYAQV